MRDGTYRLLLLLASVGMLTFAALEFWLPAPPRALALLALACSALTFIVYFARRRRPP